MPPVQFLKLKQMEKKEKTPQMGAHQRAYLRKLKIKRLVHEKQCAYRHTYDKTLQRGIYKQLQHKHKYKPFKQNIMEKETYERIKRHKKIDNIMNNIMMFLIALAIVIIAIAVVGTCTQKEEKNDAEFYYQESGNYYGNIC